MKRPRKKIPGVRAVQSDFTREEKRIIGGMSLLMFIRMLGISLVIPIFSLFAIEIKGSTEALAGLAVGIFGLSQTIFLVPMGRLSDRWGRKQALLLGLTIYFLGTVFSGMSRNIYQLIASRFLAGAGAVLGIAMAWITDGIEVNKRNRALSFIGISFGLATIAGFSLSAPLAGYFGYRVIFYTCAALIALAVIYTGLFLRNSGFEERPGFDEEIHIDRVSIKKILTNSDLVRLNIVGFLTHVTLISVFFIMPILLKERIGTAAMAKILLPMSIVGTVCMFIFAKAADRHGTVTVLYLGIGIELIGLVAAVFSQSIEFLFTSFMLIYVGHCILSPILPAAVSRFPNNTLKGTILSIFNASQFLGSAVGGQFSGIMKQFDPSYLFGSLLIFIIGALFSASGFKDYTSGIPEPSPAEPDLTRIT